MNRQRNEERKCTLSSQRLSEHVFWCSKLLIPKAIVREIESICRNFLWSGSNDFKHFCLGVTFVRI